MVDRGWRRGGREGGREGQRSKGKKRFKWWRSAAGWMCPQMICARMGGRDGTEGRGGGECDGRQESSKSIIQQH